MEKKKFVYRNNKAITIWYLLPAAPVILIKEIMVDRLFLNANNSLYLTISITMTIVVILYLWRNVLDYMPRVRRTGWYWIEDGTVCMEMGNHTYRWNDVTELYIQERGWFSGGIRLLIKKNEKEQIWILSEYLDPKTKISDTMFGFIFRLVLARNIGLIQEKDVFGNPIEYLYKGVE